MPIKNHHPVGSAENPHADPTQFMLLFRHGPWDLDMTPEQITRVMDEVTDWFDGVVKRGIVVGGMPLHEGGKSVTIRNGEVSVTDGPFVEAKEAVAGYLILKVDTMDEAVALARTSPLLEHGMITEVRQIAGECPVYERLRQKMADREPGAAVV
jgi:hypothetical protein